MNIKLIMGRITQVIVVVLGVTFFTFLLTYLAPSDPAEIMLSVDGVIPTEELISEARIEMGLDKPFISQYITWLKNVVHGDLGTSFTSKQAVSEIILNRLPTTISLSLLSLVFTLLISIPLGVVSGLKENSVIDYIIRAYTFTAMALPSFWLGLIFLSFFGVKLGIVNVVGGSGKISDLILPAITLAIPMGAKYTRQLRSLVLEELDKEYISAAKIRGISTLNIIVYHIMPNVLIPMLTLIGISFGV